MKELLGRVAAIVNAPESRRRAFVAGFNGKPADAVHRRSRRDWQVGKDAAAALDYSPAIVDTHPQGRDA